MKAVIPGKYQHYKGKFYRVMGEAKDTETGEDYVVYKQLYKCENYPYGAIWLRKKSMFIEKVEVDGKQVPRFKYIAK